MIIEIPALWLVEDCIISCYNHLAQGDYSRGAKCQNGCSTFCQCYVGSNKCYSGENTLLKWRGGSIKFGKTISKKDTKFLLMKLNKPVKFYWRLASYMYLDTSYQNNCHRMLQCVSTRKNKSITEFESTSRTIIPTQLFTLPLVNYFLDSLKSSVLQL